MNTKMIRKTLIAAGLAVALGGAGIGQAMAHTGAGTAAQQDSMQHGSMQHQSMQHDSMGKSMSDKSITSKVKSKFAANKSMSSSHISVHTMHGVVTLSGHVKSAAQKRMAKSAAMRVKGVKSVKDSGLTVSKMGDNMGHHQMGHDNMGHDGGGK